MPLLIVYGWKKKPTKISEVKTLKGNIMSTIKSLAELVQHAYRAKITGKESTELMVYKSSGLNETTNADGGYAVAPQMCGEILTATQQKSLVYSKAKIINVTKGKSVKLPYVLDSNVAGTCVTAYWPGEGGSKTVSHPTYGQHDLPLNTLAVRLHITEELMEDVQQIEGWLKGFVPTKIAQEIDARMIYGNPASSMFGITFNNANGVIGVSNSDPITLANLIAYEKKLAPASKAKAEWYMGTEQYNELLDLIDDTKTNTAYTWQKDGLYVFGHKVNACNFLKKDEYDLILADFSDYVVVQRSLEQVTSMSFSFNLDEMVMRWTIRINGVSFGNKVTLVDGSEVAPFIIPLEGPIDMSSSSSSNSGTSESSGSNSSDSSLSDSSDSTDSLSTESIVSLSSYSSVGSTSSDSSASLSSASSMSLSSSSSSSSSSSYIENWSTSSKSSASSMSNSSNSSSSSSSSSSKSSSSSSSSSTEVGESHSSESTQSLSSDG